MITLPAKVFKAFSKFASKDCTRMLLQAIYYTPDGFVATDGHVLGCISASGKPVKKDDSVGELAYSLGTAFNGEKATAANKIGKEKNDYYKLCDRKPQTILASSFPNFNQLTVAKDSLKKCLTLTRDSVYPALVC